MAFPALTSREVIDSRPAMYVTLQQLKLRNGGVRLARFGVFFPWVQHGGLQASRSG
jgi:hypothetical protein